MGELGFFQEDERVELIDGMLVRMPPIGPPHASVVDRLNELLLLALVGRARVRIQHPFAADDYSEPQPDVLVAPLADYTKDHPQEALLVIEVSDSSLAYDRKTKGKLYAEASIPEYWIVDIKARRVEVRTSPTVDGYARTESFDELATMSPSRFPDVTIRVADLFAP
jgi:Uma2 family endonuclease